MLLYKNKSVHFVVHSNTFSWEFPPVHCSIVLYLHSFPIPLFSSRPMFSTPLFRPEPKYLVYGNGIVGAPAVQHHVRKQGHKVVIHSLLPRETNIQETYLGWSHFFHSSHLLLCVDSKSSPGHTTVYNVTPIFPFSTKRPVGWPVCTTFTPFPSCLYQVRCTY